MRFFIIFLFMLMTVVITAQADYMIDRGLIKISNETFEGSSALSNWTITGLTQAIGGKMSIPTNGGSTALYKNTTLLNISTNSGNFTFFEGGVEIGASSADSSFLMAGLSGSDASIQENYVFQIRVHSSDVLYIQNSGDSPSLDLIDGLKRDGTKNQLKIVLSQLDFGTATVFINGTEKAKISPLECGGSSIKCQPTYLFFGNNIGAGISSINVSDFTSFNGSFYNASSNNPPFSSNTSITPFPLLVSNTAKGHCLYNDTEGDAATGNFTEWYINKTKVVSATNSYTLNAPNITNNANITFSCRFNDTDVGSFTNSSTLTAGDTNPPTINSLESPTSGTTSTQINILANVTDASSQIQFVKLTIDGSNHSMTQISDNIFQYLAFWALGQHNITSIIAEDSNGNRQTNSSTSNFTIANQPSEIIIISSGGGGGDILIEKSRNTTFDLLTENLGQEYFSVTAKSNSIREVKVLIENRGNKSVNVRLSCTESSNISKSKLCDAVTFDQLTYKVVPSNFPIEAIMKVRFPEANLFTTFSLVVEGESDEGGIDDLRVSFVIFPKFTDFFKILKQSIVGIADIEAFGTTIPFPQVVFLVIFEAIMILTILSTDSSIKGFLIFILTIVIYAAVAFLDLQICALTQCRTLGGI